MTEEFQRGDRVAYEYETYIVDYVWSSQDCLDLVQEDGNRKLDMVDVDDVEKILEAKVATKKMGLVSKSILGVKLKIPSGVTLNEKEANYIIDGWESQKSIVKTKQNDLASVSAKIERHVAKTGQEIPEAMKALREARGNFKKCKDPIAKRKWARKIIVRDAYYQQVRNSHQALNATVERVQDAVEDAQYIYKTLESRIAEARIYRELNGGLKLVGKTLIEARQKHIMPEVEYEILETNMEKIEKMAGGMDDEVALNKALEIVNDPERWIEQ